MRGERVTPKPPDDVRLTMTANEARRLRSALLSHHPHVTGVGQWVPGNFYHDVCAAIDEALA